MKAIIFSHLYTRGEEVFANSDIEFIVCPQRNEEDFLSLQKHHNAMAVVLDSRPYSIDFFKRLLPHTLIVRFGTGTDNIPMSICQENGCRIANTPGASTSSVCEYVFTTLGMFSQRIWGGHQQMIRQQWIRPIGRKLFAQKLAVLGLGRIGLAVAEMAQSRYQMKVIGLCRKNQVSKKKLEIEEKNLSLPTLTDDLHQAISDADFITLHLSLNPENQYLINQETLDWCQPNAIIVNTARGKHIREIDLRHALHQGKIAGAVLDVFEQEPCFNNLLHSPKENSPIPMLKDFSNVILTPHIAGNTQEANYNTATMVVDNLRAFYQNRWEDINWVNG